MTTPNLGGLLFQHPAYVAASSRVDDVVRRTLEGEQIILPLCGPSRVGKTFATLPAQQRFPRRQEGSRRIVPWLYIKMSQAPSLSSLPRGILNAVGMNAWARKGSPEVLTGLARDAVHRLGVIFLVIDEFHHYAEAGARASALDAANAVKNFVDETGLSCIFTGLPTMRSLFEGDDQLESRAHAAHHFLPYIWVLKRQRQEFEEVLGSIVAHLRGLGFHVDLPEAFLLRIYISTAGRIGLVVKLINEACDLARQTMRIDPHVLSTAHAQALRSETDGLNPFRISVSDADAVAAFARVMLKSGYPSEFMAETVRQQGGSNEDAARFINKEQERATKKAKGNYGC
ncbi:MAG: TniB family NTP-binding protein [Patescibacteria group bacterium]|nr:TniB family NTP-binding protein [Patescibacteria group bacterium]